MLTIFVILATGLALARSGLLPEHAPRTLDVVIVWVALPAVVFAELSQIAIGLDTLTPALAAWGVLALVAGCVYVIGRVRRWSAATLGTALVVVPLGNTSFLGLPAVEALLGPDHLAPALVYDQLGSFLALATWGSLLAARYGRGESPSLGTLARRLITFPPFIALLLAVLARVLVLPSALEAAIARITDPLGATLVPLALLTVGMRLRLPRATSVGEPLVVGLVLRMLLAPAALYLFFVALRPDEPRSPTEAATLLEAAMPPMVTAGVLATDAGLDAELAAALVGVGFLLAFASLPAWAWVA